MADFAHNSVFWVETEKIKPNPFQPRREFDEEKLRELADSIRQYGVLQPLVVTRREIQKEDGGLAVEYELIAGERRLRASGITGLQQVPVLIREGDINDDRVKLELAIIENVQREDLNPVDRARAFDRLATEFNFKHTDIARRINKSREYVSNSVRILGLPEDMLDALAQGRISDGHTRPLLMLTDRPDEQNVLFKEILLKRLTVRDAEGIARRVALDRARKKALLTPETVELEKALTESMGTRVQIEYRDVGGGKVVISFFDDGDLQSILQLLKQNYEVHGLPETTEGGEEEVRESGLPEEEAVSSSGGFDEKAQEEEPQEEKKREDNADDLYSVRNFSI